MKRKRSAGIATLTIGILMTLGVMGQMVSAQECYGPEAMYGEGPVDHCRPSVKRVILSKDTSSVYEEGIAVPGQYQEDRINKRPIADYAMMEGDMYSEGPPYGKPQANNVASLKKRALAATPAAGQ